jgi:SAM-dependent methyltransferase
MPHARAATAGSATGGARLRLLVASFVLLFLELACIRWFPAHVLYLTFFTNVVLLACFLGMSLGCLAARARRDWLRWTPPLLAGAMAAAHGVDYLAVDRAALFSVATAQHADEVFFGTGYHEGLARFVVPIEAVGGFFFVVLALAFVGLGQELGRALNQIPGRIGAYMLNVAASMAGIAAFAALSRFAIGPLGWFAVAAAAVALLLAWHGPSLRAAARTAAIGSLLAWLGLAAIPSLPGRIHPQDRLVERQHFWSPYYRIDFETGARRLGLWVNRIGHQRMFRRDDARVHGYGLVHRLNRDAGGAPFRRVLVIGAGSGNDLSQALVWGAARVDAVELDPVLQRIGAAHHPDRPYDDPRVQVHIDDGRNFLGRTDRRYDLIVYAMVDSLVLHSGYSNLRLESYLFTRQAFADVRRRLAPGGVFVAYNHFAEGVLVARLFRTLAEVWEQEPLVFALPYRPVIDPDRPAGFTMVMVGATEPIRAAFAGAASYAFAADRPSLPEAPSGFAAPAAAAGARLERVGPARVIVPDDLQAATDDWPFFYVRRPMIPALSRRWCLVVGVLGAALLWLFGRGRRPEPSGAATRLLRPEMFLLGAGFLLVETKAVVHMALLFGGTWTVNAIVFFSILAMILLANSIALRLAVGTRPLLPYALLLLTLAMNAVVPLGAFLGLAPAARAALSSALAFSPILFAGIVFALAFRRSRAPDLDLGSNVAGAMAGGLLEHGSTLVGFRGLLVVAMVLYALAAWSSRRAPGGAPRRASCP